MIATGNPFIVLNYGCSKELSSQPNGNLLFQYLSCLLSIPVNYLRKNYRADKEATTEFTCHHGVLRQVREHFWKDIFF